MIDRITATCDSLYSPTALAANRQPPAPTGAFFRYFLEQFRGAFYARFVLVALGSIADAMLPIFVGWTVGMLSTTPHGALFAEHGATLALMPDPIPVAAITTRWSGTMRSPRTSSTWCAGRATGT